MLDDTTTPAILAAITQQGNWKAMLAVGDIVSYRFPVADADEGGTSEPKARPCLVLDIETIGGATYALLAYGTSSRTNANRGYEIRVLAPAVFRPAGLDKPTRFVGARRLLVALDARGFVCGATTGSPVLGSLEGAPRARMNAVRGRIHAERDIAADRRASRRTGLRRSRATRPFLVEKRSAKRLVRREGGAV